MMRRKNLRILSGSWERLGRRWKVKMKNNKIMEVTPVTRVSNKTQSYTGHLYFGIFISVFLTLVFVVTAVLSLQGTIGVLVFATMVSAFSKLFIPLLVLFLLYTCIVLFRFFYKIFGQHESEFATRIYNRISFFILAVFLVWPIIAYFLWYN